MASIWQFILFSVVLTLCACSNTKLQTENLVTVSLPADHRMHFSGKGAGAGVMMASSMGPMGIAIGVAIDEGIAKDIGKAANEAELNLKSIVETAFKTTKTKPQDISIERYGFLISPSGGDNTWPELHLSITTDGNNESKKILIPAQKVETCELFEVDLTELKEDGRLAVKAFESAARCAVEIYGEKNKNV